jgi:serine/threonine-protein kinase RsbT
MALRDGYTTGGGLGLGLGGSKRLVDEFDIESRPREGTAVSVVKWKR